MIDRDSILSATSDGLNVFKYYIPFEFRLGKNFKNPFYDDKNASCNVYYDRHNKCFKIKDFGNEDYSGDCFSLVAKINNLDVRSNFFEILNIINHDLKLNLEKQASHSSYNKSQNKCFKAKNDMPDLNKLSEGTFERREFFYKEKPFSLHELRYWKKYGINERTLLLYQVKSLLEFRSVNKDGNIYELFSSEKEPLFGYQRDRFIKLYRPESKLRFLYAGEMADNYCFGLNQLPNRGDLLFITGGEKDVMSLYSKGFHAICFNSETSHIPPKIIEMMTHRFKHIILLYDTDETGVSASEQHCEKLIKFDVKRLILPLSGNKQEKDISDFFAKGNKRNDLNLLILDLLKTNYNQTMALLKTCEVDLEHPPEISENIVSVNNVPLGSQGNILCITGGEGTGKSNYASAIVSGTIAEEDFKADILGLKVLPNIKEKAVLLYDTEQSENQIYKNTSLLLRRSGKKEMPEWMKVYYLTAMSRKERLQAIQDSMDYYYHLYSGIQLVVIDGIADLVRSANDEIESIAIVEELYRLAGIYKTCIICVLHFVPNSFKLRGHLGSELQRKSASILSIEKDMSNPEISIVKTLKVRDGSPLDVPLMQFAWDKKKSMHVYLGERSLNEKEKRKIMDLSIIAKEIFSEAQLMTYLDLASEIELLMEVKERTAKNYIHYMREKKIIEKDQETGLLRLSINSLKNDAQ